MSMMRVHWEIDVDADTPIEAAQRALAIQRNPESIATVFTVVGCVRAALGLGVDAFTCHPQRSNTGRPRDF